MLTDHLITSVEYAYEFTQSIQRLLQRLRRNHTSPEHTKPTCKCGCALCHCDQQVEWRTYPNGK